jgi:3-hydroxyacyl-CoA dehydrogenase/enoyl-CoA hydratase/3-hydroxybutyryl-CoA epimerase
VNAEAIICTNTSGLPITEIASALKHPERFCGMHFFNPVNRMPLVEVIPGEKTSPETVATVVAVTKKLGKTPIVVKDVPGFLVNRILIPALLEAGWLLEEGADIERVDRLGTRFGLPMGSFVLADEVGLDVAYKVAKHLNESYGERMGVPEIYKVMMDKKLLGKKGGKGFYIHEKGKKPRVNSEVKSLVRSPKVRDKKISDEEIRDRLILVMVNEAARCLEEGVIEEPKFLDMAMIMGTGFPPFRGGLCRYADDLGITQLVDRLEQLAKRCGERFVPAEILQTMKRESKNFY